MQELSCIPLYCGELLAEINSGVTDLLQGGPAPVPGPAVVVPSPLTLPSSPFFGRRAPVLVHCYGGINRSAFVVVALLMMLAEMPLLVALRAVAANRGKVLTNRSFRAQLLEFAVSTGRLQL